MKRTWWKCGVCKRRNKGDVKDCPCGIKERPNHLITKGAFDE